MRVYSYCYMMDFDSNATHSYMMDFDSDATHSAIYPITYADHYDLWVSLLQGLGPKRSKRTPSEWHGPLPNRTSDSDLVLAAPAILETAAAMHGAAAVGRGDSTPSCLARGWSCRAGRPYRPSLRAPANGNLPHAAEQPRVHTGVPCSAFSSNTSGAVYPFADK